MNQAVVRTPAGRIFQSYNSTIAIISPKGKVTLGKHWDYSVTTGKYRNIFLGEDIHETRKKLADKTYKLDMRL